MQCKKRKENLKISSKIKRLSGDERKGTTLMSCGVAKLHAGAEAAAGSAAVTCASGTRSLYGAVPACTCVSWTQKLKQECIAPQRQAALGSSWDASRI